jgi:hypothetical protein
MFRHPPDDPARSEWPLLVDDTLLPYTFVRWVVRNEPVSTLADLVERRLMLLYHQRLTYACLHCLADLLPPSARWQISAETLVGHD